MQPYQIWVTHSICYTRFRKRMKIRIKYTLRYVKRTNYKNNIFYVTLAIIFEEFHMIIFFIISFIILTII